MNGRARRRTGRRAVRAQLFARVNMCASVIYALCSRLQCVRVVSETREQIPYAHTSWFANSLINTVPLTYAFIHPLTCIHTQTVQ